MRLYLSKEKLTWTISTHYIYRESNKKAYIYNKNNLQINTDGTLNTKHLGFILLSKGGREELDE